MKNITISKLQKYIKEKDYHPDLKKDYFLKLSEEVGELAQAIRKNITIIDLETWIPVKERINDEKYGSHDADKLFSN